VLAREVERLSSGPIATAAELKALEHHLQKEYKKLFLKKNCL
jgi:hypothetical protein